MGGLQRFTVAAGQPEAEVAFGDGGGTVTVVGGTVFYRDEPGVTSSVNDGSIVDGASATLFGTQFFSTAALRVDGQVRLSDLVGSISGTLDARNYITGAYVPRDPSTTIDLAAAIAAMENTGKALYVPAGLWATASSKNITLNSNLTSFVYKIFGSGLDSRIYLPTGMGDGEFLLRVNQTSGGTINTDDFVNIPRLMIDDLFFVGTNSPNGGFVSTTQRSFSARRVSIQSGKYGFVTHGYCDMNYLESIHAAGITDGGWTFRQYDNGDGLIINGFNAYACGGVNIQGSQGCVLNGFVSGYHVIASCDATLHGWHIEGDGITSASSLTLQGSPLLLIKNSRVNIPDGRFYTGKYPVAMQIDDSAAVGYRSRVTLGPQMCFVQWLGSPTGDPHNALQGVALDVKGFTQGSELRLRSIRQEYWGNSGTVHEDIFEQGCPRITSVDNATLDTVINARKPLLLGDVNLSYKNGAWEVSAPDPYAGVRTMRRQTAAVVLTGVAESSPAWATNQAAGTRFYQAWTRNAEDMDTDKSSEVSITTNGINPNGKLTIAGVVGPAKVRIVRGIVTGTYTEWVEFTTANETIVLHDQGTHIGGQLWSSTSVPTPPTTNDTRDGYVFRNGARRMAYGSSAPTSGNWLQGDQVINTAVAAAGVPGWVCVTAGTPGTWKAMAAVAA